MAATLMPRLYYLRDLGEPPGATRDATHPLNMHDPGSPFRSDPLSTVLKVERPGIYALTFHLLGRGNRPNINACLAGETPRAEAIEVTIPEDSKAIELRVTLDPREL